MKSESYLNNCEKKGKRESYLNHCEKKSSTYWPPNESRRNPEDDNSGLRRQKKPREDLRLRYIDQFVTSHVRTIHTERGMDKYVKITAKHSLDSTLKKKKMK